MNYLIQNMIMLKKTIIENKREIVENNIADASGFISASSVSVRLLRASPSAISLHSNVSVGCEDCTIRFASSDTHAIRHVHILRKLRRGK